MVENSSVSFLDPQTLKARASATHPVVINVAVHDGSPRLFLGADSEAFAISGSIAMAVKRIECVLSL